MRRRVRLLPVLLLLAKIDAATACPLPTESPALERRYAQASAVFVGHLVSVEEAGVVSTGELVPRRVAVEGTFRVVEVIKGRPPADGKIRAPSLEACGPILWVG